MVEGRVSSDRCAQEMCGNWSGDGRVCPCALFGLEGNERPIEQEEDRGW